MKKNYNKYRVLTVLKYKLLKEGFQVAEPTCEDCHWLLFGFKDPTKDQEGKVFYVQLNDLSYELEFSIKYKGNQYCGNSGSVVNDIHRLKNDSILDIIKVCKTHNELDNLKFYKDIEDYLEKNSKNSFNYILMNNYKIIKKDK